MIHIACNTKGAIQNLMITIFLANQVVITVKHAKQCMLYFVGLFNTVIVLLVEGSQGRAVICTGLDIAEEVFSFMKNLFASVPQWISSSNLPLKGTNHR